MKGRFLCFVFFVCMAFAFSQSTKTERRDIFSNAVENICGTISSVSPENSIMHLTQPDAYIGKVFPSIPPHFTAGASLSAVFIDSSILSTAVEDFERAIAQSVSGIITDYTIGLDIPSKLPIPATALTARIGGIFLPFDIGLTGITTFPKMFDDLKQGNYNWGFDYITFGTDLRYCVYSGNLFLPQISVGGGYTFSRHEISLSSEYSKNGNYNVTVGGIPNSVDGTITIENNINMNVDIHTLFAQVQLSKKILVFTPYLGFKTFMSSVKTTYDWKYDSYVNGSVAGVPIPRTTIEENSDSKDINESFSFASLQPQLFGGIGLKVALFQMGLNMAWNLRLNRFSGGVNLNFRL